MTKAKKVDPQRMFVHADNFRVAETALRSHPDQQAIAFFGFPALVMSAFASELLLKCLILIETERLERGHDLYMLYSNCSVDSRKYIQNIWDNEYVPSKNEFWDVIETKGLIGRTIPRDLKTCLIEGSKGFERLRYGYEGLDDHAFQLGDLPLMIRRRIIELRPQWQTAHLRMREVGRMGEGKVGQAGRNS